MLRLMTYNVHRWLGTDRRTAPGRIADVIAANAPDVVALQEVRIGRARVEGIDQATAVARALGMEMYFHPTVRVLGEQFGIAILTSRPSRLVKAGRLPGLRARLPVEPRGALWAAVEVDGQEFQIVNTHMGLMPGERLAQAEALLGPEWMGSPACAEGPAVLCGDLNSRPTSRGYRRLAASLQDAQLAVPGRAPQPTFHSRRPLVRIDHIFANRGVEVLGIAPVRSPLARVASDHLPLAADLRIAPHLARTLRRRQTAAE